MLGPARGYEELIFPAVESVVKSQSGPTQRGEDGFNDDLFVIYPFFLSGTIAFPYAVSADSDLTPPLFLAIFLKLA